MPLDFDADAITELRGGTALKIKVQGVDAKEVTLSVFLKGLSAAIDSLTALGES